MEFFCYNCYCLVCIFPKIEKKHKSCKLCDKTNNPGLSHRKALNGIKPNGQNWGLSNLKFQEVVI